MAYFRREIGRKKRRTPCEVRQEPHQELRLVAVLVSAGLCGVHHAE